VEHEDKTRNDREGKKGKTEKSSSATTIRKKKTKNEHKKDSTAS